MGNGDIRNIYCIGRNYRLHAEELGNAVPEKPMVFMKPTHALAEMSGQVIDVPFDSGSLHYETELVVRIGRPYESGIQADEMIDAIALGIDFTLRDVQSDLKKKGHPWLLAKGFRHSAPITAFHAFPGIDNLRKSTFSMLLNGKEVQRGSVTDMIFDLQQLIDYCALHYGLDTGDVIFTGTPAGVGAVAKGDHLILQWDGTTWGECKLGE